MTPNFHAPPPIPDRAIVTQAFQALSRAARTGDDCLLTAEQSRHLQLHFDAMALQVEQGLPNTAVNFSWPSQLISQEAVIRHE